MKVVITGPSHRPLVDRKDGVLYVNPGSAGFAPIPLADFGGRWIIEWQRVTAHIRELTPADQA